MIPPTTRVSLHAPPTAYHRLELDRVVSIASSRCAVLPAVRAFEIASNRQDAHHRENLTEIRAVTVTGDGPIEFRYRLPLLHSGLGSFDDFAWDVVGSAHRFYACSDVRDFGFGARSKLERIVEEVRTDEFPARLLAVGVCFEFANEFPRLSADLEMLGHDLKTGIERVVGFDADHLQREVAQALSAHANRVAVRERALSAGAAGWIDQSALRLIDLAGLDQRDAVKAISREGWLNVSFPGSDDRTFDAALQQSDGVIEGWVHPRDRTWGLKHGDLIVWGEGIPETLRDSLTHRRVGSVFGTPELPVDARISIVDEVTSVDPELEDEDEQDGWLRLTLEIPVAEVDARTGTVREVWLPPYGSD